MHSAIQTLYKMAADIVVKEYVILIEEPHASTLDAPPILSEQSNQLFDLVLLMSIQLLLLQLVPKVPENDAVLLLLKRI